jgi:hypothetical protein
MGLVEGTIVFHQIILRCLQGLCVGSVADNEINL